MNEEEIQEYALDIVRDYLDDGVEFLTIAETLDGEVDEEYWIAIHNRTTEILKELGGNL